ncbi:hypothetical protein PR048_001302 [Dryococelus australis]|uniref:Uncharacterized protein n=1 Tax=Dryococelus australis TaxID=614101 RepID=A0ABQ9IH21_9NEOP|nr:hypothetical protein PR048_001302 [Dryococelus australis]
MLDTTLCLPATMSFLGLLQQTQVFLKYSQKQFYVYLNQNPRVLLFAIGVATTKTFGRFDYWVGTEDTDNTSYQGTMFKLGYAKAWRLVSTAQNELEEARSQFDQVFTAAKMFASVMSRLLDENVEGNHSLEEENI